MTASGIWCKSGGDLRATVSRAEMDRQEQLGIFRNPLCQGDLKELCLVYRPLFHSQTWPK